MRQVQIYIEDTRESGNYNELELFQDETININLSVQNVKIYLRSLQNLHSLSQCQHLKIIMRFLGTFTKMLLK